ncbi:MAG: 16S rRNA (cytosine(1402)-N(4))-methyltransferase RsmH [Myxococcales bacterium]|nr:16S rRNA (cytosine(1402)-N(4))-methyltransferase RsmH [Myxococcales bacterium]
MVNEVLTALSPRPGGVYLDLTVGLGGHARRILEASAPTGRLLGIDRDTRALSLARETLSEFGSRATLAHARFSELERVLAEAGVEAVDGMLADLGVSSLQLDNPERGFSFQQPGPLDMRMDPDRDASLGERLRSIGLDELARALGQADVPGARRLAARILERARSGAAVTTRDLAELATAPRTGATHPATRMFLALRILVNAEVEELQALLRRLPWPLRPGARLAIISFQSLEDRAVKERLRELAGRCRCPADLPRCACGARARLRLVSRRALRPAADEVAANPRARSARLRVAECLAA